MALINAGDCMINMDEVQLIHDYPTVSAPYTKVFFKYRGEYATLTGEDRMEFLLNVGHSKTKDKAKGR